ncbi:MAG: PQQ-like beta-propeller repeat protein [Sedimentisphaerales bacterium]|nr:PQQ-like beta-propeller repeat protein [Sedimentisphaerales bacterium]
MVKRIVIHLLYVVLMIGGLPAARAEDWPQWRGPRRDGTSRETDVPVRWSGSENILWKTALPGKGHASPIVWADRIFLVTAIRETRQRILLALDRTSGNILWRQTVLAAPPERIHNLNSLASSTPCTDGQRVYVSFLDGDKMFVAAYDLDGKMLWEARPGPFASIHGYCSSPVLWNDKLILNGDHDGPGYLVALDRATGRTIWNQRRPNDTRSYCAPIICTSGDRNQLILSGSKCVASYDPDTGQQLWISDGPTDQYVASLVYNGELLFLTCGYPQRFLQGIRPDGSGNVTKTHVVWENQNDRDCAYVPSPLAFGPYFLVVSDRGVASCLRARTGQLVWKQRLPGGHSASLVSAAGRVYFLSDDGVMTVIKPAETFEQVAQNALGEQTFASPAISGGKIYIRGAEHLYCIGTHAETK